MQANALAMATRCCSPPDSSIGRWSSLSPSPTSSRLAIAVAVRSAAVPVRANSSGSMAFSSAVSMGSSWKNWKMIPTWLPRHAASCSSFISSMRLPATVTVPAVGRSIPVKTLRIVDFPLPDGPTMAISSPRLMVTSTPLSAGYSSRPVRYTFSTPSMRTKGPCPVSFVAACICCLLTCSVCRTVTHDGWGTAVAGLWKRTGEG